MSASPAGAFRHATLVLMLAARMSSQPSWLQLGGGAVELGGIRQLQLRQMSARR